MSIDIRYDIRDYRDLFQKLEREFEKFGDDASADNLFNTMVTAWSLADWVWADLTPSDATMSILTRITGHTDRTKASSRRDYHLMDSFMRMCCNVANASKHAVLDDQRSVIVSSVEPFDGGFGEGPYGLGPYGGGRFYAVYADGDVHDAHEVIGHVVTLFEELFQAVEGDSQVS